ncbi:19159_t:CDS:2, partial [Gigaspora rosea]
RWSSERVQALYLEDPISIIFCTSAVSALEFIYVFPVATHSVSRILEISCVMKALNGSSINNNLTIQASSKKYETQQRGSYSVLGTRSTDAV